MNKDKAVEFFMPFVACGFCIFLFFAGILVGIELGGKSAEKHYLKQLIDRNLAEYNPKTGKIEWIKQVENNK